MRVNVPLHTLLSAALLSFFLLPVHAAELTAERHIEIEIAAREAALAGASARLEQLSGNVSGQQAQALSEQTHQRISQVYRQAGISPGAHLAWENRHRRAIKTWLEDHPAVQQHYKQLNDTLNQLSDQIDVSLGQ